MKPTVQDGNLNWKAWVVIDLLAAAAWIALSFFPHRLVGVAPILTAGWMFQVKKDSKGSTTKFEWKRADWIGLTVLIVVCAAIFKGADPLTILRWIEPH
jgi:hypothetical protein